VHDGAQSAIYATVRGHVLRHAATAADQGLLSPKQIAGATDAGPSRATGGRMDPRSIALLASKRSLTTAHGLHAVVLTLAAGIAAAGCAVSLADNPSERCANDSECALGRVCVRSFCVVEATPNGDASIDLGAGDLGASSVDLGTAAWDDLGLVQVDLGVAPRDDLGVVATDLGVAAMSDLGVVATDLGVVATDLGVDAGRDLGVDAGRDLGVDAGRDLGVDAGRDLGVDAGRDLGVDAGPDLGVDAGSAPSCGRDTRCGLLCVDLDDNFLNCGSCGRSCGPTDRRCHRGECDR